MDNCVTNLCSETAKELLISGGIKWSSFMRHTYYNNEDGDETTPFRELVRHMPGKRAMKLRIYKRTICN